MPLVVFERPLEARAVGIFDRSVAVTRAVAPGAGIFHAALFPGVDALAVAFPRRVFALVDIAVGEREHARPLAQPVRETALVDMPVGIFEPALAVHRVAAERARVDIAVGEGQNALPLATPVGEIALVARAAGEIERALALHPPVLERARIDAAVREPQRALAVAFAAREHALVTVPVGVDEHAAAGDRVIDEIAFVDAAVDIFDASLSVHPAVAQLAFVDAAGGEGDPAAVEGIGRDGVRPACGGLCAGLFLGQARRRNRQRRGAEGQPPRCREDRSPVHFRLALPAWNPAQGAAEPNSSRRAAPTCRRRAGTASGPAPPVV